MALFLSRVITCKTIYFCFLVLRTGIWWNYKDFPLWKQTIRFVLTASALWYAAVPTIVSTLHPSFSGSEKIKPTILFMDAWGAIMKYETRKSCDGNDTFFVLAFPSFLSAHGGDQGANRRSCRCTLSRFPASPAAGIKQKASSFHRWNSCLLSRFHVTEMAFGKRSVYVFLQDLLHFK